MVASSLDMLEEGLIKKKELLEKIQEQNGIQKEILKDPENVDESAFDNTVEAKEELIDRIIAIDDGFQTLFDKVKGDLEQDKDKHKDQIRRMQELIQEVTALSASIEAEEHRNKKLAEQYFSASRQRMNMSRQTSAVAFNYYKTMNNFKDIPPQFLDKKN